jgi:hypothetical protein
MTEYACDERTGGMRKKNIARKKMKRRKKMNCALCSSKTGKEAVQCVGYAVDGCGTCVDETIKHLPVRRDTTRWWIIRTLCSGRCFLKKKGSALFFASGQALPRVPYK